MPFLLTGPLSIRRGVEWASRPYGSENANLGARIKDQRWDRLLVEVELVQKVAQEVDVLPYGRAGIWPAVCLGIQTLSS